MKRKFKVCSKCGEPKYNNYPYAHDDYCRFCGQKFEPDSVELDLSKIPLMYGPLPMDRIHQCINCGYSWNTRTNSDDEQFCPKCGSKAPITKETEINFKRSNNFKLNNIIHSQDNNNNNNFKLSDNFISPEDLKSKSNINDPESNPTDIENFLSIQLENALNIDKE